MTVPSEQCAILKEIEEMQMNGEEDEGGRGRMKDERLRPDPPGRLFPPQFVAVTCERFTRNRCSDLSREFLRLRKNTFRGKRGHYEAR